MKKEMKCFKADCEEQATIRAYYNDDIGCGLVNCYQAFYCKNHSPALGGYQTICVKLELLNVYPSD